MTKSDWFFTAVFLVVIGWGLWLPKAEEKIIKLKTVDGIEITMKCPIVDPDRHYLTFMKSEDCVIQSMGVPETSDG
ncbi:hypothetical protein [Neptuniibacter sp. QD37_11]|uniref:hypothetical protein n=1 Tax=Neptuniibacter sp. QD37_11 TaxID=3398209 RepID=UPI0039F4694A